MFNMPISILGEVSVQLPNLIETSYIYDASLKHMPRDIPAVLDKANVDCVYLYDLDNTFRRTQFKMKWLMVLYGPSSPCFLL
jgi:hypothetical protein